MTKLKHIGEYIINPDSIAYMKHSFAGDGTSLGTFIFFNAYAAAANEMQSAFEMAWIEIRGLTPVEIMDFINEEAPF